MEGLTDEVCHLMCISIQSQNITKRKERGEERRRENKKEREGEEEEMEGGRE